MCRRGAQSNEASEALGVAGGAYADVVKVTGVASARLAPTPRRAVPCRALRCVAAAPAPGQCTPGLPAPAFALGLTMRGVATPLENAQDIRTKVQATDAANPIRIGGGAVSPKS